MKKIDPEKLKKIATTSLVQDQQIANKDAKQIYDEKMSTCKVYQFPTFVLELLRLRGFKFSSFAKEAVYEKMVRDNIILASDPEREHPHFIHRF